MIGTMFPILLILTIGETLMTCKLNSRWIIRHADGVHNGDPRPSDYAMQESLIPLDALFEDTELNNNNIKT